MKSIVKEKTILLKVTVGGAEFIIELRTYPEMSRYLYAGENQ